MSVSASEVVETQRAKSKHERNTRMHVSTSADAHVDTRLNSAGILTPNLPHWKPSINRFGHRVQCCYRRH